MLKRFWRWYCSSWWHTGLVTVLTAGGISGLLFLHFFWSRTWEIHLNELLALALLALFAVECVSSIVLGIVHFCRRRWGQGLLTWGVTGACGFGLCLVLGFFLFASLFGPDNDHFADNLKLPEGVALAEPTSLTFNLFNGNWRVASTNSFQYQVLNAPWTGGAPMKEGDTGSIPALAALMKTPEGKARLIRYLACDPEWRLYKERGGELYAVRQFRDPNGKIVAELNSYYAHFEPSNTFVKDSNGEMKNMPGDKSKDYQFRVGIGLGGQSARCRGKPGVTSRSFNGVRFSTTTCFDTGGAFVEICDETVHPGRQMTAKALELVDKEFAALELPPDAVIRGAQPDLVLTDGMEGGIYAADILCNPGEQGELYLKAYEITQGTRLSEGRLGDASSTVSGWSADTNELFSSQMYFTIYEGNWGQYYGARFELWFKPTSGAPERKLIEKNYKIQGWMR